MASTITLQQIIDPLRTYPELQPLTSAGGFVREPAMSIANTIMQRFLAVNMNWKWNRAYVPAFLTVPLQQDYVNNVTDLSWIEQAWRIDINNSSAPKPIFTMEASQDLGLTSFQANPFNLAWIPNRLAQMGTWQANTLYGTGYGAGSPPVSPIQQFTDANSNILFINSNSLNLSINSPGYSGTPINTTPPFGTSGGSQPLLSANSAAGTTVVDGTVTWTVADPNGFAIRLSPVPASGAITWLVQPVYQKKPPRFTSFANTISPIPDELEYLFRQGFLARAYMHSLEGQRKAPMAYAEFEEDLMTALRSADREPNDSSFYPSDSITGGSPYTYGMPIGPAWPYQYGG